MAKRDNGGRGTWTHLEASDLTMVRESERNAWQALEGMVPGQSLLLVTKGQMELLDIVEACLKLTGPADATISTWTTHSTQIEVTKKLCDVGKFRSLRWLVDAGFATRPNAREAARLLRERFGDANIRTTRNHAKFAVLRGPKAVVVIISSMNLNQNPRLETAMIYWSEEMADFFDQVVEEVFMAQPVGAWATEPEYERHKEFSKLGIEVDGVPAEQLGLRLGLDLDDPHSPGVESWR